MSVAQHIEQIRVLMAEPSWAPPILRVFLRPYRRILNHLLLAVQDQGRVNASLELELTKVREEMWAAELNWKRRTEMLRQMVEHESLSLHGQPCTQAVVEDVDQPRAVPGVNLVGWLNHDFGIAEGARIAMDVLAAVGIPYQAVPFPVEPTGHHRRKTLLPDGVSGDLYPVSLFFLDARFSDQIPEALGPDFLQDRYNILYFHWELPRLPESWASYFQWCDEVWVPSRFVRDALCASVDKPVTLIPHAVGLEEPRAAQRSEFGLPEDAYIFLVTFDFHSELQRKNPMAAIRAFQRAFAAKSGSARLVIKTQNGDKRPEQAAEMRRLVAGHPGIIWMDRHMEREELTRLQAVCDAYVSTHRSEGFGLGMVEAMALGKPVLATPWSGSQDFIREGVAFPLPCGRVMLEHDIGPYPAGEWWAEPREAALAGLMLRLAANPELGVRVGARAKTWVRDNLSPLVVGRMYQRRLTEIFARVRS